MKVPLLDLKAQYAGIRDEIEAVIREVCESQMFVLGGRVEEFEKRIAEYCGVGHAVGISSGTDAILVALMAMGAGPGVSVFTTPYTFFATAGCIVRVGATPVFVDVDPVTFNMCPARLENALREHEAKSGGGKPGLVMPVHLYGQVADMGRIKKICGRHGHGIIEDAAQAIGAEYPSAAGPLRAGSMGNVGCFSFFPSKNLGGFGDGGMAVTNDGDLAEKIRVLRNHGAKPKYFHGVIGGNFRLDALQAAVLQVKLGRLEDWHEARRKNAARYDALFAGSAVRTPRAAYAACGIRNHHIYNQYVIRVPDRDMVRARLEEAGVGCEIYYPLPLHLQECFSFLGYAAGDMPESEAAAKGTLALPIYPEIEEPMQEYVADTVLKAVS